MKHAILFPMLLAALIPRFCAGAGQADVTQRIQFELEVLAYQENPTLGGETVRATALMQKFYSARAFRPAWNDQARKDLIQVFRDSAADGLIPEHYHLRAIDTLTEIMDRSPPTATQKTHLDLLLTAGLIRLARHLEFGKVDADSLASDWDFRKQFNNEKFLGTLSAIAGSSDLPAAIDRLRPNNPIYRQTKAALARYREIERQGGWQLIPNGLSLKMGQTDERVNAIRARLAVTGKLDPDDADNPVFDEALDKAVRQFQERHYLIPDGVVGPNTLAALNVPISHRIDQLRANLERARWVLHGLPGRYILVDIAGFMVHEVDQNEIVWSSRAVVGRPYRQTPVFKSKIDHLVFNPTWTIPPTILREDVLPAQRKDPSYLRKNNIRVLDRNGNVVDDRRVDWSRYPGQPFPYILRQDSGPENALGRLKFMFPNPFLVYLHDTPSRELFRWDKRAFSSGCIRLDKPYEFAERLLGDPQRWSEAQIRAAVDTGRTRTVHLDKAVPVILFYWTAGATINGEARFKTDIYERDRALIRALDSAP